MHLFTYYVIAQVFSSISLTVFKYSLKLVRSKKIIEYYIIRSNVSSKIALAVNCHLALLYFLK